MIQHYDQLVSQIKQFKLKTQQLSKSPELVGQIQKIYSSARYICISIRFPGKTRYLYIGRGSGFEGIWEGEKQIPAPLRRQDKFLEYVRRHLSGCLFLDLDCDEKDRIALVSFQRLRKFNQMGFFWKGRRLYFANVYWDSKENKYRYFASWSGQGQILIDENAAEVKKAILEGFDQAGRTQTVYTEKNERLNFTIKELIQNELEYGQTKKISKKKITVLEKKRQKILSDLKKIGIWRNLKDYTEARAEELEALDKLEVDGATIKFHKDWSLHKKIDAVFDKIKRFKSAEKLQRKREQEVLELLDKLTRTQDRPREIKRAKLIAPVWMTGGSASQTGLVEQNTEREFYSFELGKGLKLYLGKSARGNDYLRSRIGKKTDLWFHLEGDKSAHAILKFEDQTLLNDEVYRLIGSIIAHYSHYDGTQIPLIYTQLQNIRGVRKSPGTVTVKKAKYITVENDKDWQTRLPLN